MSKTERYTVSFTVAPDQAAVTIVPVPPDEQDSLTLEKAFRVAKLLAGWEVRQRVRGNRFGPIFAQCPVSRVDLPGDVYREALR